MDNGRKNADRDGEHGRLRVLTQSLLDSLQHSPSYDPNTIPDLYEELRRQVRVAQRCLRTSTSAQARPLLADAFEKSFGLHVDVPQSGQLTILAGLMRRLIVDYAKARKLRNTRGGMGALMDEMRERMDTAAIPGDIDVVAMDAALTELEQRHRSSARLIELRYFADLGTLDIALELGLSTVVVETNLRFAKTWLFAYLQKRNQRLS